MNQDTLKQALRDREASERELAKVRAAQDALAVAQQETSQQLNALNSRADVLHPELVQAEREWEASKNFADAAQTWLAAENNFDAHATALRNYERAKEAGTSGATLAALESKCKATEQSAPGEKELEELRRKAEACQAEVASIQQRKQWQRDITDLRAQLATAQARHNATVTVLEKAVAEANAASDAVAALENQIEELQAKLSGAGVKVQESTEATTATGDNDAVVAASNVKRGRPRDAHGR